MTDPSSSQDPSPDPDAPDTDPLPAQNPFGASWGAGGWGAGFTDLPRRNPAVGAERPDLVPQVPDPFAFPSPPERGGGVLSGRMAVAGVGVLVLLAAVGGLIWLLNRSPSEPATEVAPGTGTTAETTTEVVRRDARAEAQLLRMLPAGYPPGSCRPVEPRPGTAATVDCTGNSDPGGPASASYSLAADRAALDIALTAAVRPESIVVCPGNIQSPGPWRRNAAPDRVAGTLVCGMPGDIPTVVWTDVERMVVSVVRSDPPGPGLDQLYLWWSTHS
jgi:serine/threonine kinase PknH